jgi:V/A-type H+-transporting ATPase subunit C
MEELVKAKSLQEAFLPLRGTGFDKLESIYSSTGDLKAIEAELFSWEIAMYVELFAHLRGPVLGFVRALARAVEIEAVKSMARLWFDAHSRGRAIDDRSGYLYRGRIVETFDVDAIINSGDVLEMSAFFHSTPYAHAIASTLPEAIKIGSMFELESSLDRFYFDNLISSLSGLLPGDKTIATRFVGIEIDIYNITCLVRLRSINNMSGDKVGRYLVDSGSSASAWELQQVFETGDIAGLANKMLGNRISLSPGWSQGDARKKLAGLERILRKIRKEEAERLLGKNPFSLGIILAYLVRREHELHTIRSILNAKYFGLGEDRIRSVL